MPNPKHIVITGASSGIGAALAKAYAAPDVVLGLIGRSGQRLEDVAEFCRERGAKVGVGILDVRKKPALSKWLIEFDEEYPIDLLIANAGISAGTAGGGETEQQVKDIFDINVNGVFHTVHPVLPLMQERGQGQVAIVSSIASIRGFATAPAYSASKAAVRSYGEALRGLYRRAGVQVNVVLPGFIKTPMTDINDHPMPFLMEADVAAQRIIKGLSKNKGRIAFPLRMYLPLYWISCLPLWLTAPLFNLLPGKPSLRKQQ